MTWDSALRLLAGLSLPAILLFHLLARRRRELTVPSLYLWQRLLEHEKPSLRLRRLVSDILLVLQLMTAALIVLALAGPRLQVGATRISGPTVLAVDVSAGMGALEADGFSRMEAAREEAIRLIRGKAASAEMAVLAGGATVSPVSGFSRSRRHLLDAVRGLEAKEESGRPDLLLRAAGALSSARRGSRVIFITDAAFDDRLDGGAVVEILQVGKVRENLGLSVLDFRRLPGGGGELLISVVNTGDLEHSADLTVTLEDRELLGEQLNLPSGETVRRSLVWQEELSGRLSARLSGPEEDALAADNEIELVLEPENRIRTVLYTPGNWFLETLLKSHPGLDLRIITVDPEADGAPAAAARDAELLILDRAAPAIVPELPVLAVYPFVTGSPGLPIAAGGFIAGGDPVSWDDSHPVLVDVNLSRVSVSRSVALDPLAGTSILAESASGPVILAGEDGRRRWTAQSFNFLASSLPVNTAFPILLSNTIGWLVPGSGNGSRSRFAAVDSPENSAGFPSAGESDLSPRWTGGTAFTADSSAERQPEGFPEPKSSPGTRPLTAVLLLAALFFLLAEWWMQLGLWRPR